MTETVTQQAKKHFTPRKIAGFVVSNATRFVVTAAITSLVPTDTKLERVKLAVGTYFIASIVADKTQRYMNHEIDQILEVVDEIKSAASQIKTDIPNP